MSNPQINYKNRQQLQKENYLLAEALDDIYLRMAGVATQTGTNLAGGDVVPANVAMFHVKHLGAGVLHFGIIDGAKIDRAIDYVVELASNPGYSGSEKVHFGSSRNGTIPGVPDGIWYLKAYSQYRQGGPPSNGITSSVIVSGSPFASRLASQGAGTGLPGATGDGAGMVVSRTVL